MTRHRSPQYWFYLTLSIVGLITAWVFNGLAVVSGSDYVDAWFSSPVDWVLSADLLVAAIAGSGFIINEGRRLKMKNLWLYIALSTITAFAFTFPLFLAMRENQLSTGKNWS